MTITLEVGAPTPSLNRTLRSHWRAQGRQKKRWAWMLRAAPGWQAPPPVPWSRGRLTITRFGARILDHDNFVGGCKSTVIDNLRQMGFFADDSPAHLTVTYRQHAGRERRTVIELDEVAAECST